MLNLYAVRMKKDRQPVGFIWARNRDELLYAIDAATDPADCEIKKINALAAVMWLGRVDAWKMGISDGSGEHVEPPNAMRGASFEFAFDSFVLGVKETQGWTDALPEVCEP